MRIATGRIELNELEISEKAGMITAKEYVDLSKYTKFTEKKNIKLKKEIKVLNQIIEVMVDFYLRKKIKKNKKSPTFNFNFFN